MRQAAALWQLHQQSAAAPHEAQAGRYRLGQPRLPCWAPAVTYACRRCAGAPGGAPAHLNLMELEHQVLDILVGHRAGLQSWQPEPSAPAAAHKCQGAIITGTHGWRHGGHVQGSGADGQAIDLG